jgi:hypothetical protein
MEEEECKYTLGKTRFRLEKYVPKENRIRVETQRSRVFGKNHSNIRNPAEETEHKKNALFRFQALF